MIRSIIKSGERWLAPVNLSLRQYWCSWVIAAAALIAAGCSATPSRPPEPPDPADALARSLGIIRSATVEQPRTLRILFYGQSISSPKWTDDAIARLRIRFPNVAFDVRNLALGGFAAHLLEGTVERDIAAFQPDLIVFHVYGDHRAYERIIRVLRSRSAADIIVQTDHVVTPGPTAVPHRLSPALVAAAGLLGPFLVQATQLGGLHVVFVAPDHGGEIPPGGRAATRALGCLPA